jgi:hypothetical protein
VGPKKTGPAGDQDPTSSDFIRRYFSPVLESRRTPIGFWRGSFLSVAPGPQNSRRNTGHNRVLGNVVSHDCTCTYDGVRTHANAWQYRYVDAYVGPIANEDRLDLKIRRNDRNI